MQKINAEIVREFLDYDTKSGLFKWKSRDAKWFKSNWAFVVWNKKFAGKNTGCVRKPKNGKKYLVIAIFNKLYYAHRLAYLYVTGEFPAYEIDHKNGNGIDNSWLNLAPVTKLQNMKNTRKPVTNTSGVVGVTWDRCRDKWAAQIDVNGKHVYLGRFDSFDNAVSARKEAEIIYGFHANHGQERPL